MNRNILISNHPDAQAWADGVGLHATILKTVCRETLSPGDRIFGQFGADDLAMLEGCAVRCFQLSAMPGRPAGEPLRIDEVTMHRRSVNLSEARGAHRPALGAIRSRSRLVPAAERMALVLVFTLAIAALTVPASKLLELGFAALGGLTDDLKPAAYVIWLIFGLLVFFAIALAAGLYTASRLRDWANPLARFLSAADMPGVTRPRAAVALALSNFCNPGQREPAMDHLETLKAAGFDKAARCWKDSGAAPDNELAAALGHKWVMNIRALRPHAERLTHVFVIASRDPQSGEGSGKDAALFADFLAALFKKDGRTPPRIFFAFRNGLMMEAGEMTGTAEPGVDFASYDALFNAFDNTISFASRRLGLPQDDICIDVTSGTKQVSIAGATVTLNRESVISYVDFDGHVDLHDGRLEYGLFVDQIR